MNALIDCGIAVCCNFVVMVMVVIVNLALLL